MKLRYRTISNTIGFVIFISLLSSCSIVKRVKSNEYLVTENVILEDGKKSNEERVNNIIIQKTNSGMQGMFKFPLKLHIYNLPPIPKKEIMPLNDAVKIILERIK